MKIEFSTDPISGEAQCRDYKDGVVRELSESDVDIIENVLSYSKTFHPEQYKAVSEIYKSSSANKRYYNFVRARRIINCCYGENDRQPDIEPCGVRYYEFVKCPLIAECKWFKIICQPEFSTSLSDREKEVMSLYFEGYKTSDIADKLFLSIHTVNNHRCNSLAKLELHSIEEFISFAHKNKMFNSK